MKRTFNYTGRRSILREDVFVTIRQEGAMWAFDADLKLGQYKFPHNAEIWLEAHCQNLWMQWPWGTISSLRVPERRQLSEFDVPDGIIFRVRVVQAPGAESRKLLGEIDGIKPIKAGEADDRRRHLLVPVPDALDQELWKLDIDHDPPRLLVNRDALPSWKELARSPYFRALVYPEVFRRILFRVLIEEDWDEGEESDWKSDWMVFAKKLGGLTPVPPAGQIDERTTWIDDAVAGFSRRMQLRSVWDREQTKE